MRPKLESRSLSDSGSPHLGVPPTKQASFGQRLYASDQSLPMTKNAYLTENEEYVGRERSGFEEP
jgi:hypothetical protein